MKEGYRLKSDSGKEKKRKFEKPNKTNKEQVCQSRPLFIKRWKM